jgi:hypothetical protein
MSRFTPDTLRDALWRPIAMGAPDSGVYVEIMAPDVRFACLLLLTLAIVVLAVVQRRNPLPRPTFVLLLFTWIAFVPWLITSGNGRYFIPVLLIAGPMCLALIWRLPATRGLQLVLAAIIVALQGLAVFETDPRGSWRLAAWEDNYFKVKLTQDERTHPAAYVIISSMSYSLVAPQFDPRSRWIGVASVPGNRLDSFDGQRIQELLKRSHDEGMPIRLLVSTLPGHLTADMQPDAAATQVINRLLAPHHLALDASARCKMHESETLAGKLARRSDEHSRAIVRQVGFWNCPLEFPATAPASPTDKEVPVNAQLLAQADRVFEGLERSCPRLFIKGEATSTRIDDGFVRAYSSDIRAYVMDDGGVYFKYWRALNANRVGTMQQVLAPGFTMDCNQINGRSGLPWERIL